MKSQEEQWLLTEKYGGEKSDAFFADCKQLALGVPLGYLIGHVPFLNCTIHLDNHPLIPRGETEFWVEKAIAAIKESQQLQDSLFAKTTTKPDSIPPSSPQPNPPADSRHDARFGSSPARNNLNILDLCAGSGCIGVAVAKAVPEACVDFSEIDARLLSTIETNCIENSIATDRVTIHHSNLFENLTEGTSARPRIGERLDEDQGTGNESTESYPVYDEKTSGARNEDIRQTNPIRYDFILSNPPYIDPALDRATESVTTYEPHLALYGGQAGLEIIEQLIKAAPGYLNPHGQLWIEHEPEQSPAIAAVAHEHGFTVVTYPDQYGVDRYSILVLQTTAMTEGNIK